MKKYKLTLRAILSLRNMEISEVNTRVATGVCLFSKIGMEADGDSPVILSVFNANLDNKKYFKECVE